MMSAEAAPQEMFLFYLNGFTVLVYIPAVACTLLGVVPLESSDLGYIQHLLPLVLATELWQLAVNHPFNDRRQRQPVRALCGCGSCGPGWRRST